MLNMSEKLTDAALFEMCKNDASILPKYKAFYNDLGNANTEFVIRNNETKALINPLNLDFDTLTDVWNLVLYYKQASIKKFLSQGNHDEKFMMDLKMDFNIEHNRKSTEGLAEELAQKNIEVIPLEKH